MIKGVKTHLNWHQDGYRQLGRPHADVEVGREATTIASVEPKDNTRPSRRFRLRAVYVDTRALL